MLETNKVFRKLAIGNSDLHQITPEELETLHETLLGIIADIDEACRKHQIRYVLSGGSALGAVRHKGFIPWDDDIDLYMPRKDYELFRKVMKDEYSDRYWVGHIEENPLYDLNFMKIRKKNTKYLEIFEPDPEHAGIFVDIFPIDNIPNNPVVRFFHGCIADFLLLCASCVRIYGKKEKLLSYAEGTEATKSIQLKSAIGKCLSFQNIREWCRTVEKWSALCKNENSKYISIPSGVNHYFGEMYHRASFFPTKDVKFEDKILMGMNDPEEFLVKSYGDYHQIPAPEKREIHSVLELKF